MSNKKTSLDEALIKTIGDSTRSYDQLVDLLHANGMTRGC